MNSIPNKNEFRNKTTQFLPHQNLYLYNNSPFYNLPVIVKNFKSIDI